MTLTFDQVMKAGGGWGKLLHDRPPTSCLLEAQKYVQERLEKKWLPLFLATEAFYDRQRPQSGMGDVVEDVMIQRKKKSQAIWKVSLINTGRLEGESCYHGYCFYMSGRLEGESCYHGYCFYMSGRLEGESCYHGYCFYICQAVWKVSLVTMVTASICQAVWKVSLVTMVTASICQAVW